MNHIMTICQNCGKLSYRSLDICNHCGGYTGEKVYVDFNPALTPELTPEQTVKGPAKPVRTVCEGRFSITYSLADAHNSVT